MRRSLLGVGKTYPLPSISNLLMSAFCMQSPGWGHTCDQADPAPPTWEGQDRSLNHILGVLEGFKQRGLFQY